MNIKHIVTLVLICLCISAKANDSELKNEEVTVACYKAPVIMVYVEPSKKLETQIIKSFNTELKSGELKCKGGENEGWYCKNPNFKIFQALDGNGKKLRYGLVCNIQSNEKFKFYSKDFLLSQGCVNIYWDEDSEFSFYEE